ncbi:viroplasmin family protein [Paenibacillus polymyxa]|nr:ribonuclease H family protein [Paenibacillus polymyxa]WPQ59460.1 ribonuclease H family protein [Paenibacillus polymyxa]
MAKKKMKFYAIRSGQDPITKKSVGGLILNSWDQAKEYVTGVKGAEYKSFEDEDAAKSFLQGDGSQVTKALEMQPDVLYCYVDGSYNNNIPNYSYGICAVLNEKVVHIQNGQGNNPDAIEMQQIGGELLGAITSLQYAKNNRHPQVVILHDYLGVAHHATGFWKRTNKYSERYFTWMQNFFSSNTDMKVNFVKVKAHTGNNFNEIADGLAKLAIGIKPDAIFYRMVEKHHVSLKDQN